MDDPVIDEVRRVRHEISARFGHDTKALMDHYRELERKYADRILHEPAGLAPTASRRPPTD